MRNIVRVAISIGLAVILSGCAGMLEISDEITYREAYANRMDALKDGNQAVVNMMQRDMDALIDGICKANPAFFACPK